MSRTSILVGSLSREQFAAQVTGRADSRLGRGFQSCARRLGALRALRASAWTRRDQPGPIAQQLRFVKDQSEGAAEFVLDERAVLGIIATGEEPAAVFRIGEIALAGTGELPLGHGLDLARSVARSRLRRPSANFPFLVEHQAGGAVVFEDGEVVDVLVEFHAAIESAAVLRVAVESLAGAPQTGLLGLADGLDLSGTVDDAHDAVGGRVHAVGGYRQ